jgi:hypothetical protein
MRYRIYFSNFSYYSEHRYCTVADALEAARKHHFQARIETVDPQFGSHHGELVATYCPLMGVRYYPRDF